MSVKTSITWYVARRDDGYFSCGTGWIDDLVYARFHVTIGPVKAAVTRYVKQNPGKPIPEILEWKLDIASATVMDVAGETQKRIMRAAKVRIAEEQRRNRSELEYLKEQEMRIAEKRKQLEAKT